MILSILIPTLPQRSHLLNELLDHIHAQIKKLGLGEFVEIIIDVRTQPISTGEKRNFLLNTAKGQYIWFIDDDDWIVDDAIFLLMEAMKTGADVIGISGWMTTDGKDPRGFEIRIGHPYEATTRDGKEFYLRFPNHITPMLRSKATQATFEHITVFEDFNWAKLLQQREVLKTMEVIEKPIYHYRHISKK